MQKRRAFCLNEEGGFKRSDWITPPLLVLLTKYKWLIGIRLLVYQKTLIAVVHIPLSFF